MTDSGTTMPSIDSLSARKAYRAGMHRTAAPEQTLARLKPLLPLLGITRVANVTGLDRVGIPVVMVCRPNSRSLSVAQGKGLDLPSAKVSGVMEAIETHHAETIGLPLKLGSHAEMCRDHRLADVARLTPAPGSLYHDDLPMLWIEGWNLIGSEPVWLPYELVHTNYTVPLPPGSNSFATGTSGLAAGNHRLEAISYAIWELMERDAETLWHFRSDENKRRTGLDLNTVGDPACRLVLEKFERAGVDVRVWDITSDLQIASFTCLLMGNRDEDIDPEFGLGCHSSRNVALLRALTEAAQARLSSIVGARDDLLPEQYSPAGRARRWQACDALLEIHAPERPFHAVPSREPDCFKDEIAWSVQRLRSVGVDQILVVDLTKPMFGIPVVRVVVPGLEGCWSNDDGDYTPGLRAVAIEDRPA
jgi:ribosomal protein S12 methylthiotransferase accessory factor